MTCPCDTDVAAGATHFVKIAGGFHVVCACGWSSAATDPKRDAWALFAEHKKAA